VVPGHLLGCDGDPSGGEEILVHVLDRLQIDASLGVCRQSLRWTLVEHARREHPFYPLLAEIFRP
jgi:hypothetical protein